MRKFDYSFLKENVPVKIVNISSIIYDIKGKESVRLKENPSLFDKLKAKAIIDSVKGSNAIENIKTADYRLGKILAGEKPLNHDEKALLGYRNVLNDIHKNSGVILFDKTTLLSLHKSMYDVAKLSNRGCFKSEPNYIVETTNGVRNVRFNTVSPKDTEFAIEQLLLAYHEASRDPDISSLLLIPCVILDFLCIHPFDDGNGRVSRLLTLILLYKSGFDIGRFISVENMINEHKYEYYASLQQSSINWHKGKNDYSPFIVYMLQILYLCYTKLDENVFAAIDNKFNKSERIEFVVNNAFVPISKNKICELLPDISKKMVETVLGKLLKEGSIIKLGSYKNATYYRK